MEFENEEEERLATGIAFTAPAGMSSGTLRLIGEAAVLTRRSVLAAITIGGTIGPLKQVERPPIVLDLDETPPGIVEADERAEFSAWWFDRHQYFPSQSQADGKYIEELGSAEESWQAWKAVKKHAKE